MQVNHQERKLREAMAATRQEYVRLDHEYDKLLMDAHRLEHGTEEMVQTLISANEVGRQAAYALWQYRKAVEELTAFYQRRHTATER
jgi:hypothetical protein